MSAAEFLLIAHSEVEGEDAHENPFSIKYTFELGPPSISFKATNAGPICTLTAPVTGGTASTDEKTHNIAKGAYALTFDNLQLGTANVEDTSVLVSLGTAVTAHEINH